MRNWRLRRRYGIGAGSLLLAVRPRPRAGALAPSRSHSLPAAFVAFAALALLAGWLSPDPAPKPTPVDGQLEIALLPESPPRRNEIAKSAPPLPRHSARMPAVAPRRGRGHPLRIARIAPLAVRPQIEAIDPLSERPIPPRGRIALPNRSATQVRVSSRLDRSRWRSRVPPIEWVPPSAAGVGALGAEDTGAIELVAARPATRASARGGAKRARAARPPVPLSLPAVGAAAARSLAGRDALVEHPKSPPRAPPESTRGGRLPGANPTGVALGSLASCKDARREDRLESRVIAYAAGRDECASEAGRYRFVEKRNLNAFLMWVERNPARARADRCAELKFALACLQRAETTEVSMP